MPHAQPPAEPAAGALAHADISVRVDLSRPDLAGKLLIDGQPATAFTGWIGLLTALDQALDTLYQPGPESRPV